MAASPSLAQQQTELDAIGLVETFTDVTVQFQTPLGVVLPVRFHGDRSLSGNSGAIARHLGSQTDRGRWWVEGSQLCQKWNIWFDGTTNCVRIFRSGDQFTWQGPDGKTGRGAIVRQRMLTQKKKRRLPAPSALGASLPKLNSLATTQDDNAIGRYSQPLRENRQSYKIARFSGGEPIRVTAYPSHSSQVLGVVDKADTRLPVWGSCANGWCPVVYRGKYGWVQQRYLDRSRLRPNARVLPGQNGRGLRYRVSGVESWDVLNVRSRPNMDAGLVGQFAANARNIKLIGVCRKLWCPVRVDGQRGWVNSHYLAIQ